MSADQSSTDRSGYLFCPRECGVNIRDHQSSDLIDGLCDIELTYQLEPLLDVGGYLACGCHGTQREHTCIPND